MSVCGRPDTAAILLPSPMALPPLRNGGRRIPEASANDGCTRGRPRRHGSVRPSPETCAGNQVQRWGVEWSPPDRRTTSIRGSEGDTHLMQIRLPADHALKLGDPRLGFGRPLPSLPPRPPCPLGSAPNPWPIATHPVIQRLGPDPSLRRHYSNPFAAPDTLQHPLLELVGKSPRLPF